MSAENRQWTQETMRLINDLTPSIEGKAFDPDWFLLRQRFEQLEDAAFSALVDLTGCYEVMMLDPRNRGMKECEAIVKLRAALSAAQKGTR